MLDEDRGPEEDRLDGLDSEAPTDASQGGGLPCRWKKKQQIIYDGRG